MPYTVPTLQQLVRRLWAAVESRLPGTDPRPRRSYLGAISRGLAGGHHEMYGYLSWVARNAFPDSSDEPELLRWAEIWGIFPLAAAPAFGEIRATGVDGTVIARGTVWRSSAGVDYETTAEGRIAAGEAVLPVRALEAGAQGNAEAGARMSATSPIAGLSADATTPEGLGGGSDAETPESVLLRLLARIRNPPRGGAPGDYVLWARSAHADVTRVWERLLARGLGTVDVYFMTDGATPNGIPQDAVVAAIQAFVDKVRPTTADVSVLAPAAVPLDVSIRSLVPDTADVRAAVEAEISDLLLRDAEPGGTILVSRIREAVSVAAGERDHVLVSPVANVDHAAGSIAVPGKFSWA